MAAPSAENLKVLICTANMGNAEPTATSLATWVPPNGSCQHVTPLKGQTSDSEGTFDVIIVGMQEATWKKGKSGVDDDEDDDDDMDEKLLAQQGESSPNKREGSASKLPDFKLESLEAHDSILLRNLLQETLGNDYSLLVQKQRGQMRLYIFVRKHLVNLCQDVKVKCENTGIGHVMANKGGIVASFTYRATRLSFFSAHLAAHEGESYYAARCDNVREILRGAKMVEPYDAAVSSHCLFICGDLNFRTRFPGEMEHEEKVKKALDLVDAKDWETLYSYDELQKGIKAGDVFQGFQTLPCNFSPTFKVLREAGFVYKQQRTPSYADRVLWKCAEGLEDSVKPWAYEACPGFITSDHKPVRAAFFVVPNETLPTKAVEKVHLIFQDLKCTDLPVMDVDGSSDPYLSFVLSPDLRANKQSRTTLTGGKKTSWAKTKFVAKNLNPVWEEEVNVVIEGQIGTDAMLFVTAKDYDLHSKDDLMCTLALNIQDLVSEIPSTRTFDRPLYKYGKESGRIRFTLQVLPFDSSRTASSKKTGVMGKAKKILGIKEQQK